MTTTSEAPFHRAFVLEAIASVSLMLFAAKNVLFSPDTALHRVIAIYLLVGGAFLFAIAVRRRRGPPFIPSDTASWFPKLVDKLSASKPYGFICLAITPLPMGYGGFGLIIFLLLYLASVNAMRLSDEELMSWLGPAAVGVLISPKGTKKVSE